MKNLIAFGGAAKALGDGKFRAPLVTFTTKDEPDLTGDYFDKTTNFWTLDGEGKGSVVLLYGHGQDPTLGLKTLGSGKAAVVKDDAGIWMEGQLDLADAYEKRIYSMIEAGKMGTSSGAVAHMVTREKKGDAYHIKSWPLFEGSLTPTPAESKHFGRVLTVKELRLPRLSEAKDAMVRDYDSEADSLYEGIGTELISDGLRLMANRLIWSIYRLFHDTDVETGRMRAQASLTEMTAYASRYIDAVVAAIASEETDEGEDPASRFDLDIEEEGIKGLLGEQLLSAIAAKGVQTQGASLKQLREMEAIKAAALDLDLAGLRLSQELASVPVASEEA